jgi:hypothetical protein
LLVEGGVCANSGWQVTPQGDLSRADGNSSGDQNGHAGKNSEFGWLDHDTNPVLSALRRSGAFVDPILSCDRFRTIAWDCQNGFVGTSFKSSRRPARLNWVSAVLAALQNCVLILSTERTLRSITTA